MNRLNDVDYPIDELLLRRWSPRAFADKPVPTTALQSLFEAARWSPSCFNEQPWAFIVGTKDQPEQYAKVLSCLVEFNRSWAKTAPVLIVAAAKQTFAHNGKENKHAWHDVGLAVANLTCQASSLGLFVHQMGGILPDVARETFRIPAGCAAVTGLAIGYLGDPGQLSTDLQTKEATPMPRKSSGEFVFGGDWGTKASFLR